MSISFATENFAPDFKAAIESAPLPHPKSSTRFPLVINWLSKMYLIFVNHDFEMLCFYKNDITLKVLDLQANRMPKMVHLRDVVNSFQLVDSTLDILVLLILVSILVSSVSVK